MYVFSEGQFKYTSPSTQRVILPDCRKEEFNAIHKMLPPPLAITALIATLAPEAIDLIFDGIRYRAREVRKVIEEKKC